MINAILGIACIGAIAAFLVMWSKYDEQKKLTQEEKEKRWDEISRSAGLEKEIEEYQDELWKCAKEKWELAEESRLCGLENYKLHSKLSALLCPTNNHVWKDGVCVKCWMVRER